MAKTNITVQATVNVSPARAWQLWNGPEHIVKWNFAVPEWHTPRASNDLKVGGKLKSRMEAKDGSMGFDFEGTYTELKENELIEYLIADGRKVTIHFKAKGSGTEITETFEAEGVNPVEMQRNGWQAILNNFKKYAESL
jgi:uncharacterized protein YndB with AHSA1/START domain